MYRQTTTNVVIQRNGASRFGLWTPPAPPSAAATPRLTHIVPFFRGDPASARVQELTAASLHAARAAKGGEVRLASATLEDEFADIPAGFEPLALRRTILDVGSFRVPRRLPLLFDILDLAGEAAPAHGSDYIIFTNADICVQPHFYDAVRSLLRLGFDALIINRRTVADLVDYGSSPELAAFETGQRHRGYDCFVFRAARLRDFVRSQSCVGMPFVMRPLIYNLVALSERLLLAQDAALTWHYGNDRPWKDARFSDYEAHNKREATLVAQQLNRAPGARERLRQYRAALGEPELGTGGDAIGARARRWLRAALRRGDG